MDGTLLGLLIGIGSAAACGIGVALFSKFFPKEKTFKEKIAPLAEAAATGLYFLMGRWLKTSEIDKIEEGVFKTVAYWLDGFIAVFMAKLDNLITEAQYKK